GAPGYRRRGLGLERRAHRARGRHRLRRPPAGPLRTRPPRAAARLDWPRMIRNIAAYRFVEIADPVAVADRVREWAGAGDLRGTVLVAPEGINLFLAGADAAIGEFLERLRADARFAGLQVRDSWSRSVPFARLKVKLKREIISFRREDASPLDGRAPTVAPAELARWLQQGHDDRGRPVVLLDTRNREETAHGAFAG